MGTCGSVLVHHRSSSLSPTQSSTAMKLHDAGNDSFRSNIPPSPIKHIIKPTFNFSSFGSKEENFFDSRAYLESDCEDDFYSVNGDFTPSRGNTPVHHSFSMGIANNNNNNKGFNLDNSTPEPSPRKRLFELFRESRSEFPNVDEQNAASSDQNISGTNSEVKQTTTILDVLPKSANGTPYVSGPNSLCSSERTANEDESLEREKPHWSMQGCLPNVVSCSGFSPRKKKTRPVLPVVPTVAVNSKV